MLPYSQITNQNYITMKSMLKIAVCAVFAIMLSLDASYAQERRTQDRPSPNAAVSQDIGTTTVSITYGRPALKDRTYFADGSQLAPTGKWWRTGANESTAITFSGDVMVGDKEVKAGTYSLYTIPGKNEWTIIINSKMSWGTQYDEAMDVVRVPAAVVVNDAPKAEHFTIFFDTLSSEKAHLNLHWGTTKVAVPISVK